MQEIEPYWDERLFAHDIEAISWGSVEDFDDAQRWIALTFSELVDGDKPTFEQQLFPYADKTKYRSVKINDDLEQRGILKISVEVFRDPPIHSVIYIKMEGEKEPLRVVQRY